MSKKVVSVSFSKEEFEALEEAIGESSKNAYIREALSFYFKAKSLKKGHKLVVLNEKTGKTKDF